MLLSEQACGNGAGVRCRMLYGFSRDRAVPFWWLWQQVDDHGVPVHAGPQYPQSVQSVYLCLFVLVTLIMCTCCIFGIKLGFSRLHLLAVAQPLLAVPL